MTVKNDIMSNEYTPHELEWTDEKVSRFWNFRNNYQPYDDTWFTQQVGNAVLKFVHGKVPLKGKILDYGTGKGFLVQYLLENYPSAEIFACDFTDSLVAETAAKFSSKPAFKGCAHLTTLPSAYEANYFDVVFLIETIEHLTDNYINATMQEINRILKPGGVVVITTPNVDILEKTYVQCADCGATFHHMQHIRKWNANSLESLAKKFNFSTMYCKGMNIQWYTRNGLIHRMADQVKQLFSKPKRANLVYIGKKK